MLDVNGDTLKRTVTLITMQKAGWINTELYATLFKGVTGSAGHMYLFVFTCGLLDDAMSKLVCAVLYDSIIVNNKLECMRKEAAGAKVTDWDFQGQSPK